jgi:hypothetical protein
MERSRIDQYGLRLVESADQVLSFGMIYPGFSPHAGIDLRHQTRRDLHKGNTPLILSFSMNPQSGTRTGADRTRCDMTPLTGSRLR